MRRVTLSERPDVVRAAPGLVASVAVPVVRHPQFGECVVVSRRAAVNGHTGERMTNAGEIVLFGGSVEAGETPAEAALRELCEEAGTMQLLRDGSCSIRAHLGTWTTEAGFHVEGYAVGLPSTFVDSVLADDREVAEVAYLPVADVMSASVDLEFHVVQPPDRILEDPGSVAFESPTLRLRHPVTGDEWVLWGLAGFMIDRWRRLGR